MDSEYNCGKDIEINLCLWTDRYGLAQKPGIDVSPTILLLGTYGWPRATSVCWESLVRVR